MKASLADVSVRFGETVAVSDASIEVSPGEILAIVGENGAGKSTLMNVLFGMVAPTSGEIIVNEERRTWNSPSDAIAAGIGMVHQHFMLVESMTVLENVVLGSEPTNALGYVDFKRAADLLRARASQVGEGFDLAASVRSLSVGQRQLVEILRLLYRNAELLILDEPTAVLTPQEKDQLFGLLRNLAAAGKSILLITHKLDEVMELADRIVVMRAAKVVWSGAPVETSKAALALHIVGREMLAPTPRRKRSADEKVLQVSGLVLKRYAPERLSFDVFAGQVVGIAGVSGNGQADLVRALVGLDAAHAGSITFLGREVDRSTPGDRRGLGLSYIPEDRQSVGLALDATVAENAVAGWRNFAAYTHGPLIDRRAIAARAQELIQAYGIRVAGPSARAATMSGGNRQKLVVARELSQEGRFVIAENPTWGVDLGAIAFIHAEIMHARNDGKAVLLLSTDLDEIFALSDRIMVMLRGRLSAPVSAGDLTAEQIGLMMTSSRETIHAS